MSTKDVDAKQKAMDLAEDAREKEWKFPSFTAELFRGSLRWDLMHPFPAQSEEDKKIGDEYAKVLMECLEKHVDPIAIDDTGEYPREAIEALAATGVFGMKIAKEYGGLGFSVTNYCRMLELIGSYCQNTTTYVSAHQSIGVPQPLKMFGTEEQKKKFLPRLAKGEISAFALTEPDVGSDPAKMTTTATPSEDGSYYLINGEKLWCTNGPDADILVVMARTPPKIVDGKEKTQITAFIVEKSMPGFSVAHHCDFMGLRGISNGLLKFENVKVPKENIIGKPGDGLRIALATLNTGRLGIPASSVGGCKVAVKEAAEWANKRVQWGRPIGKHQAIAKKIANMAANTFAMESVVRIASAFADKQNADIRLEAAIAKYFATEMTWKILDDFIQVRGGRGFETAKSLYARGDKPVPADRMLRDSRVGRIFEGSSEIMHLIMAREAMDMHLKLAMPILDPKPGDKEGKLTHILRAAKFYAKWYPRLWWPAMKEFNVKTLSPENHDHLNFIERSCRKLARRLFHAMAKYQKKLEYEQLLLANFVEIGVDLFVMSATLAYAEHLMRVNPKDSSPQELADLFCKNARERIHANFRAIRHNHYKTHTRVANSLLEGKYHRLYEGVITQAPPAYRPAEIPAGTPAEAPPVPEHAPVK